ncbi:MAG: citrate transporter [Cyanobacteria bacterium]|nr:citrate transporter [Cyanobacteriota bacterium]
MYTRRVSALLALPIMAVVIAIISGIPGKDILDTVISSGSLMLHNAYTTTMFGAILAELMNRHGIAKALVRWVAEFAGDNPYLLGVILTFVTALLFSTLGGLGAVIMIGTIILPVMLSIGISNVTAGGLYLFGISLGGMFNLASWQVYKDVLEVDQPTIVGFVTKFAFMLVFAILLFLAIELRSRKNLGFLIGGAVVAACCLFMLNSNEFSASATVSTGPAPWSLTGAFCFLIGLILLASFRSFRKDTSLSVLAIVTPLVPLFLVLAAKWEILPAFVAAITYGVLVTWRKESVTILTRSIIDGITSVIPAVFLMIGIGMLIAAVKHPNVSGEIGPLISKNLPVTAIPYVILFTIIAPLSLYRGPLSLWGMGSGLVKLLQGAGRLSGQAIMGMLISVGQIQGICDPTNTHNIWIATYLGTDTHALLKRTIPYAWTVAFLGLVLSCILGYVPMVESTDVGAMSEMTNRYSRSTVPGIEEVESEPSKAPQGIKIYESEDH